MAPPPAAAAPRLSDWLLVLTLGLIWGASFMSVSVALEGFGPISVAALRILLGALALWALGRATGQFLPGVASPEGRRIWLFAAGLGLFSNVLPFGLLAWGQQWVASGFAGITMAAIPLFVMGLSLVLLPGERLTLPRLAGFALGMAGVVLLIGPQALAGTGAGSESLARMACIGAALSYALGAIVTRRAPVVDLVPFGTAALIAASLLIVPVALAVEGLPAAGVGPMPLLAVLYLGLGSTGVATLILVRVIRSAGPTFLSQVNYQVPVWSVIFGIALLGEVLPKQFLLALGLILGALALSRAGAPGRPGA